ncbi:MAG TPA: hypothetical protein VFX57_06875 [Sulfuricurvum sp.]|nr:hypothetical protein [Sulfuricurvum sp.]
MGYRPKHTPFTHLTARRISYQEGDKLINLVSFNRDTMTLEVTITEDGNVKTDTAFPFAHLPKKVKQQLNPLQ